MSYVYREKNNRTSFFVWYYAFSVALCPFFSQYDFFIRGFSIAEFMLISACVPLAIINHRIKYKNSGAIIVLFLLSMVTTIIALTFFQNDTPLVSFEELLTRWIRYGAYAVLILLVSDNCYLQEDNNVILKIYRVFCYLFGIYAILQAMVYLLFHYMLPINVLPISWSRSTNTDIISNFAKTYYFRGFGPFQEPSYLSKYLLPGLALSLFGWSVGKQEKKDYKLAGIITIAILLSTSVQGILLLSITYIIYIIKSSNQTPWKKIAFIFIIVLFSIYIFSTDTLLVPKQRIVSVFEGDSYGYSSEMRLYRGFAFWAKMPLLYKIIGTGLGNMGNFAYTHNIVTVFDYAIRSLNYLEYGSGLSLLLAQSGLIGFLVFLYWCIKSVKRLNLLGKIIFLQFFLVLFSGSGLFSITSVFYCALVFMNTKKHEVNYE